MLYLQNRRLDCDAEGCDMTIIVKCRRDTELLEKALRQGWIEKDGRHFCYEHAKGE